MTEPLSPVESYLAKLFDRLAGQGAAGRQLLVETEDHLRCAVADLEADGMSLAGAELAAIERIGPPEQLAGELRAATVLPWSTTLARLVGAAWLLGAVGLLSLGASGFLAAGASAAWGRGAIAADPPDARYSSDRCAYLLEYYPQSSPATKGPRSVPVPTVQPGDCRAASIDHHYEEELRNRFAAGVLGLVGLATLIRARQGRGRLRRLQPLTATPSRIVVDAVGATAFGVGAVLTIGQGVNDFAVSRPWGAWAPIVTGIALLPAGGWFAYRTLRDLRQVDASPVPAFVQP